MYIHMYIYIYAKITVEVYATKCGELTLQNGERMEIEWEYIRGM